MKSLRITIDGKSYDVDIEILDEAGQAASLPTTSASRSVRAAASQPVAAAKPAPKPAPTGADGAVISPLSGTIVSIDVQVGQAVTQGEKLITLEAMKMHTVVSAPQDGTVSAIHVQAGSSVDEGQPLMALS